MINILDFNSHVLTCLRNYEDGSFMDDNHSKIFVLSGHVRPNREFLSEFLLWSMDYVRYRVEGIDPQSSNMGDYIDGVIFNPNRAAEYVELSGWNSGTNHIEGPSPNGWIEGSGWIVGNIFGVNVVTDTAMSCNDLICFNVSRNIRFLTCFYSTFRNAHDVNTDRQKGVVITSRESFE